MCFKLKYGKLLSNFAFTSNLRPYDMGNMTFYRPKPRGDPPSKRQGGWVNKGLGFRDQGLKA